MTDDLALTASPDYLEYFLAINSFTFIFLYKPVRSPLLMGICILSLDFERELEHLQSTQASLSPSELTTELIELTTEFLLAVLVYLLCLSL